MDNFGILYRFELKKILQRRMVRTTFVILLEILVAMNIADLLFTSYTDGEKKISAFEKIVEERDYARRISGRAIDDTLLSEMQEAYGNSRIVSYEETEIEHGGYTIRTGSMTTSEFIEDGRTDDEIKEDHKKYKKIYDYVWNVMGPYDILDVNAEELYYNRRILLDEYNFEWGLTADECDYWQVKEEEITEPFIYEYCDGFMRMIATANVMNYLWIFLIAICLANAFAEEHLRRTDQTILCSRYGKKPLYLAKLAAGVTFGVAGMVLCYVFDLLLAVSIYGADGLHAALQVGLWMSSWHISVSGALLILFLVSLVAAVFMSILTMFLSEWMKNGVATLGAMTGFTIVTIFANVPTRYRLASQLYRLLPTKLLDRTSFVDNRLFRMFGKYFTGFQVAPVLYVVICILLVLAGYRVYKNYQVGGRD